MKYLIYRESKYTGSVEILQTKCTDTWCGERYYKEHPDRVWKFSKAGAKKIIERKESNGWNYKYWMEQAAEE